MKPLLSIALLALTLPTHAAVFPQVKIGKITNNVYSLVSPLSVGPSESSLNLLEYFPAKDHNGKPGAWFFTQSEAQNPNGDVDWEKQYTWGFNSVNGSVQNTNEHSTVWSLETQWDPTSGDPGQRQMEYYQIFNARSNTFGGRIEGMVMREPSPISPIVLQKDFMITLLNIDGPGSTNASAMQVVVGATANEGASLTINGNIVTATNKNGGAGLTTYGGGVRNYDVSGTKYFDAFTLGAANDYGAFLEGKDGNQVLTLDLWTNVTFGTRVFVQDGTAAKPTIARSSSTVEGIVFGSQWMGYAQGSTIQSRLDGVNGVSIHGSDVIAWTADGGTYGSFDLGLSRDSAGVMKLQAGGYGAAAYASLVRKFEANSAAANTLTSGSTIAPTNAVSFVSGTTGIDTITAPAPITSTGGQITLIPTGAWSTTTNGNIALATTAVVNKALIMTYDHGTLKWYPSY